MAKHEFGIMQTAPQNGKKYKYEPQKYNCISVNDDYIENIVSNFNDIDFYWHSLDNPRKGIFGFVKAKIFHIRLLSPIVSIYSIALIEGKVKHMAELWLCAEFYSHTSTKNNKLISV